MKTHLHVGFRQYLMKLFDFSIGQIPFQLLGQLKRRRHRLFTQMYLQYDKSEKAIKYANSKIRIPLSSFEFLTKIIILMIIYLTSYIFSKPMLIMSLSYIGFIERPSLSPPSVPHRKKYVW